MTQRKTLWTKPLTSCRADMVDLMLLAASLAETSKLLLHTCKSLFALGEEIGYKWDKKKQKWVGT